MPSQNLTKLFTGEQLPLYPDVTNKASLDKWVRDVHEYLRRLAGKVGQVVSTVIVEGSLTVQDETEAYSKVRRAIQFGGNFTVTDGDDTEEALVNVTGGGEVGSITDLQNEGIVASEDAEFINIPSTNGTSTYFEFVDNGVGGNLRLKASPVTLTAITGWKYDTTTHKFQIKTRQIIGLAFGGAESGWTDVADGSQPVSVARVVRDVDYNTSSHVLSEDVTADVYVLEKGTSTDDVNIDTASNECT